MAGSVSLEKWEAIGLIALKVFIFRFNSSRVLQGRIGLLFNWETSRPA